MFSRPKPLPIAPGQESVWDYPRPPRLEPVSLPLNIVFNGVAIAETTGAYRMLETSHPPVYYLPLPPADIQSQSLQAAPGSSCGEWKGIDQYYNVVVSDEVVSDE